MEQQHTLRQLAVVQSVSLQHLCSHGFIVAFAYKSVYVLAQVLLARLVESIIESEALDVCEIYLLKVSGGDVIVCIDKGKHVLEHT